MLVVRLTNTTLNDENSIPLVPDRIADSDKSADIFATTVLTISRTSTELHSYPKDSPIIPAQLHSPIKFIVYCF